MDKTNAYGQRLLENKDITLYLTDRNGNVEEISYTTNAEKLDALIKSIELVESNTNTQTIEYIVTLHDFEDFDDFSGKVDIEIKSQDLVSDTQYNFGGTLDRIGVGNEKWVEKGDNTTNPKYTAFRNDIVDFINPDLVYMSSTLDYSTETLMVEFKATDDYLSELTVAPEYLSIVFNKGDANYEVTATTENVSIVDVSEEDVNKDDEEVVYKFQISGLDLEKILEGEQYAHYSGPISLVFNEGVVTDTSGNRNPEKTITVQQDGDENSNLIVDVVNPLWTMENLVIDYTNKFVTLDICGTDKYYKSDNLTEDGTLNKVGVYLDGVLNEELVKELVKEEPIYLKDSNGNNTSEIIGTRKSIKISGFERATKLDGKDYKER